MKHLKSRRQDVTDQGILLEEGGRCLNDGKVTTFTELKSRELDDRKMTKTFKKVKSSSIPVVSAWQNPAGLGDSLGIKMQYQHFLQANNRT